MFVKSNHLICLILFVAGASGTVHYGHIRLHHCQTVCHDTHEQRGKSQPDKPEKHNSDCQICLTWFAMGKSLLPGCDSTLLADTNPQWDILPLSHAASSACLAIAQPRAPPR